MNCENCEDRPAKYRLKVEDLGGKVIDQVAICEDCMDRGLSIGPGGKLECD